MPGPMGGARRHGGGEKPANLTASLRQLMLYCKNDLHVIVLVFVLAAISSVLMVVGPNQISRITDYIFDGVASGISAESVREDVDRQVMAGEADLAEISLELPEGADAVAPPDADMGETDAERLREIAENVTLSDQFAQEHADEGIDFDGIASVGTLLIAIYVASALANFVSGWVMAGFTQRLSHRMRCELDEKVNRLPLAYFTDSAIGDVLSRMTNDVDTISLAFSQSATALVSSVVQFVGCIALMLYTSPPLAFTVIVTSLLGIFLMGVVMGKSQRYFRARQEGLGALNGSVEEMFGSLEVVRTSGASATVSAEIDELANNLFEADYKSIFLSGLMQPLMTFVGNLGYAAVCVVGAMLCSTGSITFGVITAFLIYVRLFEQPLRQIAQAMTNVQSAAAASERIFAFLEEPELEDETAKRALGAPATGAVDFEHVRFAYPSDPDKVIIHDFSAHVEPGQTVAIVGPTGAGKTTLVNLLMRFFEIDGGRILIDGQDTRDLTRSSVHDQFGMVLQDTWLFEGTVRENLVYNLEGVSDERLEEAVEAAGLTSFVSALPKGLDSVIDDECAISAGQRQLLTIARAMVSDRPMLILDEATSNVDTRTEMLIGGAMDRLSAGRTSFVIAHRLSTIRDADQILVLVAGDVVEQGTHDELLAAGGVYADLYNTQFQGKAI